MRVKKDSIATMSIIKPKGKVPPNVITELQSHDSLSKSLKHLHIHHHDVDPSETALKIALAPKEIPPPSDAWRQTLPLTAKWSNQKLLSTANVTVTDSSRWSTMMDEVQGTPFLFVSSGAQSNNLFVIQNTAANNVAKGEEVAPSSSTLQIKSAFSAPYPIYHMSIMGKMIATAGPNSRIQLFKIDPKELSNRGKGMEHVSECALGPGKLEEVRLAPPGTRCASVRVHSVQFAPTTGDRKGDPKMLLALEGRKAHLWDLEASKVTAAETCGHDQLMSTAWSPHAPYGTLFAAAGVDHNLYLLDARLMGGNSGKSIVWSIDRAHGGQFHGAITAVQFSPFVPYWLASAGEESVTKIWDIRFLKYPSARIDGHYHGVRSLAWSNTHADVLSTGSDDRSWRVWSLDHRMTVPRVPAKDMFVGCFGTEWGDPSKLAQSGSSASNGQCVSSKIVAEVKNYSAPIIAALPSSTHLNTFYTLSAVGEVSSHTLTSEIFNSTLPHRYLAESYPQEYEIERAIHSRDLTTALTSVINMSRSALRSERTVGKTEKEMIELCTPKPALIQDAWKMADNEIGSARRALGFPSITDAPLSAGESSTKAGGAGNGNVDSTDMNIVEAFRTDLETYSYHLPPGFGDMKEWYSMVPAKTQLEFEMIVTRFQILSHVLTGSWEAILKAEKTICKGMEKDPTFMEPDTLQLLVESVLPNDFIRGLNMGIHFAEVTEDLPTNPINFPKLAGLFHLLLFPTVYDKCAWLIEPSNVEQNWNEGRGNIRRQSLLREFLDFAHGAQGDAKSSVGREDGGLPTVSSPLLSNATTTDSQQPPLIPSILVRQQSSSASLRASRVAGSDGTPPTLGVIGTKMSRVSMMAAPANDASRNRSLSAGSGGAKVNNRTSMSVKRQTAAMSPNSLFDTAEESLDDPAKRKAAIDAFIANTKVVIAMARTELAVLKLLNKSLPNEDTSEDLIKAVTGEDKGEEALPETLNGGVMASKSLPMSSSAREVSSIVKYNYRPTISATTNRLYLDALLLTKRYEEYFQMCIEFVTTYHQFDFSMHVLRYSEREGIQKLRGHLDSLHYNSTTSLNEIIKALSLTPDVQSALNHTIRAVRGGLAVVSKVGTIMAQSMETKSILNKEGVEIVARCISVLNTCLPQLSTAMLKAFDSAEKLMTKTAATSGAAAAFVRDAASLTIEEIRQAVRGFPRPTDGKTRAFAAALSAATGASVRDSASGNMFMEEVYAIMDKLGKIVKPAVTAATAPPN